MSDAEVSITELVGGGDGFERASAFAHTIRAAQLTHLRT